MYQVNKLHKENGNFFSKVLVSVNAKVYKHS